MQNSEKIIKGMGAHRLMELMDIGRSAVSEAKRRGRLPASWYLVVRDECAARDIPVSENDFNFKAGPLGSRTGDE